MLFVCRTGLEFGNGLKAGVELGRASSKSIEFKESSKLIMLLLLAANFLNMAESSNRTQGRLVFRGLSLRELIELCLSEDA